MHFRSNTNHCERNMRLFTKTTLVSAGLLAAITTIGVYGATAGNSVALDRPAVLQAQGAAPSQKVATAEKAESETKQTRVIRIVGPRFFPDNGDIKLHGAPRHEAVANQ